MKKISYISLMLTGLVPFTAQAKNPNDVFRKEVLTGLDIVGARRNVTVIPDVAPGELGADVYQNVGAVNPDDIAMFIPTTMYMRAGIGLNLGFATSRAQFAGAEYESSGSWSTQIGLGWNLSSYVRTELDFQESTFKFSDLKDMRASSQTIGGMLYFDLARRYVQRGDITRRRTFVPFMGLGAGVGYYKFQGTDGANGVEIAAPRAALGFNVMLNDVIGIDVMYQYQMMINNGFGWDTDSGVYNISNVVASFRINF